MSSYAHTGSIELKNYPLANPVNDCLRFTDKETNSCDIAVYSNYWREQIQLYGQKTNYYVSGVSAISADNLYGEQPTARYAAPQTLIIGIVLAENALLLSRYGLVSDDEVTGFIHISSFYATFGNGAEPKSGDVFSLVEYGNDRPGSRGPTYYEITQRQDQDIGQINILAGHYVWLIKAKRYEYSFEPGLTGEQANTQVYDDTVGVGVSGAGKNYTYSASAASISIFNYGTTTGYDDVYGGY